MATSFREHRNQVIYAILWSITGRALLKHDLRDITVAGRRTQCELANAIDREPIEFKPKAFIA